MHLRLGTRLTPLLFAFALLAGAGCHRPPPAVTVEWRLEPAVPVVDQDATVTLTVLDAQRQPVIGATLDIEGHMSHPGMAPVVVRAVDRGAGIYDARLAFTMGGDWFAIVSGTLRDGQSIRQRAAAFRVRVAE